MRRHAGVTARARALLAVVVAAAVGVLAACSDVPTSGPVVGGNSVRAQGPLPYVAFGAAPPRAGDDPAGIVDGFFDAMSAYQPGYEIAKQFLTPEAAAAWDPGAGITIHRGSRPSIEVVDADQVQVTMTVSGRVSEDGSYDTAEPESTRQFDLRMRQVEGEWRIADPPAGTIISEDNFIREFEAHDLCFFDPGFDVFVFDPVYVPKNGQTTTLLTQRLLAGPSEWLDSAVRTAFPEAATLGVPSVPVEAGTATVDLSEEAQTAESAQRVRMAAQLACTFSGMADVSEVVMSADEILLLGQDDPGVLATVDERYDPDLIASSGSLHAVRGGNLVRRLGDDLVTMLDDIADVAGVSEVGLHSGAERGVVVDASRNTLWTVTLEDDQSAQAILEGTDLASPSWDRADVIWAVDRRESGGELVAARPDGSAVEVRGPELEDRDVSGVSVSPDGTRMALVVDGTAYMAIVVRDSEEPDHVSVERLRRVGPQGTTLDVEWYGAERLALLLQGEDDDPEIFVLDTFGAVEASRGTVQGAISLAAGPTKQLVVATDDGTLLEHESRARWVELGEGSAPAYP